MYNINVSDQPAVECLYIGVVVEVKCVLVTGRGETSSTCTADRIINENKSLFTTTESVINNAKQTSGRRRITGGVRICL